MPTVALVAAVVVAVDQASKTAATVLGRRSFVRPVTNPRFSLGLAGASLPVMLVISAVGIAAFGWFVVRQALRGEMAAWIPGFLVGGAVSNVADRVIGGSVRDFVATAPVVWNVADVAVVVGLVGYSCARLARPRPARGGEAT